MRGYHSSGRLSILNSQKLRSSAGPFSLPWLRFYAILFLSLLRKKRRHQPRAAGGFLRMGGAAMNLELSLKQTLKLSPQMLQSMEILQMSTLELGEFIQELVQENPAAEVAEPPDPGDESEELWRRLQSLADLDHQN